MNEQTEIGKQLAEQAGELKVLITEITKVISSGRLPPILTLARNVVKLEDLRKQLGKVKDSLTNE